MRLRNKEDTMVKIMDENKFTKQLKALRKYFMKTYKQFIFDVLDEMKRVSKEDGCYSTTLDIDEIFNKVYGQLQVNYIVKDSVVYIEGIEPSQVLLEMHRKMLPIYKGIPYRNKRDLFKIKLLKGV